MFPTSSVPALPTTPSRTRNSEKRSGYCAYKITRRQPAEIVSQADASVATEQQDARVATRRPVSPRAARKPTCRETLDKLEQKDDEYDKHDQADYVVEIHWTLLVCPICMKLHHGQHLYYCARFAPGTTSQRIEVPAKIGG